MAKKLWGGRFKKKTDPLVEDFTRSIEYDQKLARWDLWGSIIHVKILKKSGYLTSDEADKLTGALTDIDKSVKQGGFKPDSNCEDIHSNIQNILQEKTGDLALKLHTARSRNDQVVLATKMYCQMQIIQLRTEIVNLISAIRGLININKDIVIPGFTHLQHAQPVYLKDYLSAYTEMLDRDSNRLGYIAKNMKIRFGAGALAGTPIPSSLYNLKGKEVFQENEIFRTINLEAVTNSLDSVSDRDFVIEILSALSIIGMHLSRLSEDLIIWSTKEFGFVDIDDSFCTGSSLMPQKKNPDVLELIRGYAGRLNGNLVSVLTMMKGLALAYNRDMQLDKEPLFNSFEIVSAELRVLTGLIKSLNFNKKKIDQQLTDESLYATDLVYYLVDKKVPFKEAHDIIGKLVRYSVDNSILIKDMPGELLNKFSAEFVKEDIVKLFNPKVSVQSKKSINRKKRLSRCS